MELTERETAKGLFASGIVTVLCWAAIGAFVLALAGCAYTLQNDGEAGFKYSTSFAFFHTAKKTTGGAEDDVAKSSAELPEIIEWLLPGPPAEGEVTPSPMAPMCLNGQMHLVSEVSIESMLSQGATMGQCAP